MVVYLVCFSLEDTPEKQQLQLAFWLEFLNSALSLTTLPPSHSIPKWNIMLVGLHSDAFHPQTNLDTKYIKAWQSKFKQLPLFTKELFATSALQNIESISHLLQEVKTVCSTIFDHHTILIPRSYRDLLTSLQTLPTNQHFISTDYIFQKFGEKFKMTELTLKRALQYLHTIGQIVVVDKDAVCTNPVIVPKITSKFISPSDVRAILFREEDVVLLEEEKIQCILDIDDSNNQQYVAHSSILCSLQ
jgi:hypothetical protein